MKTVVRIVVIIGILFILPAGWNSALPIRHSAAASGAAISVPSVITMPWSSNTPENDVSVTGTVTLNDQPVAGIVILVNGYTVPQPTAKDGTFVFPADRNSVNRYVVQVKDASNATIDGTAVTSDQQAALEQAAGGIDVHYDLQNIQTETQSDGTIKVTGTASFGNGDAPPPVVLYGFRLFGTVTDASGSPVEGASVSTRAADRSWTLSSPTDAAGHYQVAFWPNSAAGYRVVVIDKNGQVYNAVDNEKPGFTPLKSAQLDLALDASTHTLTFKQMQNADGIIYQGLRIGVASGEQVIQPVSVTWPDKTGQFSMVLPASAAGKTLDWWQSTSRYYSTIQAQPGGNIDTAEWPTTLDAHTPHEFAQITLPG
jgi:hypothetical protein